MISAAVLLYLAQASASPAASPAAVPSPRPTPVGPVVVLDTSAGRIRIGLYEDKSPVTVKPTDAPIHNEARNGVRNSRGTIAMARTNDPNSATAQFFINLKNNASL